jgi:hypothetical protein
VTKVELSPIREHDSFTSRSIIITDESGERHEVSLFTNSENEDTLKVLA